MTTSEAFCVDFALTCQHTQGQGSFMGMVDRTYLLEESTVTVSSTS